MNTPSVPNDSVELPDNRTVAESTIEMIHRPQPEETNPAGFMHGGRLLFHLDSTASMVGMRHAGRRVVTAAVERVDFLKPIAIGGVIRLQASVNDVSRSSIQVGIRVDILNPFTGEATHAGRAYFMMVALDDDGKPARVPGILIQTPDQERRQRQARARREYWKEVNE